MALFLLLFYDFIFALVLRSQLEQLSSLYRILRSAL
jgi:hypothetical protein